MSPQRAVHTLLARFLCCAVLCLTAAGVARAQEEAPAPAYLAVVEGVATIERDGEAFQAVQNMPLIPGDSLRTQAGRVEVRFPDGTGIEVSEYSQIEVVSPTRVRLIAGSIDRLEALPVNTASASYLPQDLQMYGTAFDQYGSWQNMPSYGNVWYPRVAPDWRPYYNGYWEPVSSYGWTWIGADRWSWPTHHYGRWGYARNAWFWIPGRTFSAAWVSWGAAAGYVSWCPLGFDNRAVFALSIGYGSGWNGWTVLPRTHFGVRGYHVDRFAVAPHRLSPHTAFVTQRSAPVAVPRFGGARRLGNGGDTPRVGSREPGAGTREAGSSTPQVGAGYAVPRQAPYASRPANGIRPTTNDPRIAASDQRPATRDQGLTTNDQRSGAYAVPRRAYPVTVPRTTMPSPSYTVPQVTPRYNGSQVTPRSAPERVAPPNAQPQVMPRYNQAPVAPAATIPRVSPYDSRPSMNDSRPTTNDQRSPASGYRLPTTEYRRPTTDSRPPATDYRRPSTDSRPPPQAAPQQAPAQRSAPAATAPAGTATPRSGGEGRSGGRQRG